MLDCEINKSNRDENRS